MGEGVPARGVRIRDSSLARLYYGEPMHETMGLMGVPSLCTLGRLYICGAEEYNIIYNL